jgi:hypothetical protein
MFNPFRVATDFLRFARSYKDFSRRTVNIDEAHELVQARIIGRGANFLQVVERNVFGNPGSPYHPLFEMAGCEYGDLTKMIESDGLDKTLVELRRNGVYFTFEEYKGRQTVVRGGRDIPLKPSDFDNIAFGGRMEGETGGSTGNPNRYYLDFDHIAQETPTTMLAMQAYGVLEAPVGIWMGVLPDASGPANLLRFVNSGHVPEKWFANVIAPNLKKHQLKSSVYNRAIVSLGRRYGVPIPSPEPLSLDEAAVVAKWVSDTIRSRGKCILYGQVSKGLRVAIAALESGLDLTGATFLVGGEPITPAKVSTMSRSGAVCIPVYAFSEHGKMGMGCTNPISVDEVHLFEDLLALIQHPREVAGHDIVVDSFHWTSLSIAAPKVLINVESDDYGIVEERACGCLLHAYGFKKLLRNIRSFSKLTGEGVTLVGRNLVHVLEEVLPSRFGGSLLDYQLAEEEDDNGVTRVNLIIDPKIQIEDENEVISAFLQAASAESVQQVWAPANTIKIKRAKPILTARGKLLPLHLYQASDSRRPKSA